MMHLLKIIWEVFKVGVLLVLLAGFIANPTAYTATVFYGWAIVCLLWEIKDYLKEKLE